MNETGKPVYQIHAPSHQRGTAMEAKRNSSTSRVKLQYQLSNAKVVLGFLSLETKLFMGFHIF